MLFCVGSISCFGGFAYTNTLLQQNIPSLMHYSLKKLFFMRATYGLIIHRYVAYKCT